MFFLLVVWDIIERALTPRDESIRREAELLYQRPKRAVA